MRDGQLARRVRPAPVAALVALAVLCGLAVPVPADAAVARPRAAGSEPYVPIGGAPGPGPARFDRVFVRKVGPARARNVLVLIPGTFGGAGDFTLVARDLVARVPDLQVWSIDRRPNALEDTSLFRGRDPDAALDYYLRFREVNGRRFTPPQGADMPYAREWGLTLSLEDVRRVVLTARAGGRRTVLLGGHSLGGGSTLAYASWDFAGRPGYRDVAGLVLIDGSAMSPGPGLTPAAAQEQLDAIDAGDPFLDLLGLGLPWAAGVFGELGGMYAALRPDARSTLQEFPLVPPAFKPAVPATNEAQLGYAFDAKTSPSALALIHVNSGHLARTGDPRAWVDDGPTPIQRVARTFWQEPGNFVEWFYPRRLSLDVSGVRALRPSATTRLLGLRPFHQRKVNVPVYAFGTSLADGRVEAGARRFVATSRVPFSRIVSDRSFSHLDPLIAAPGRNTFLRSVVPFLRRTIRAAGGAFTGRR